MRDPMRLRTRDHLRRSRSLVSRTLLPFLSSPCHALRKGEVYAKTRNAWLWAVWISQLCNGTVAISKKTSSDWNNSWNSDSPICSNHFRKPITAVTCSSGSVRKEGYFQYLERYTRWRQNKLQTYYYRFKGHANPKANPVFTRFEFCSHVQDQSKRAEKFTTDLGILAQDCDFVYPEKRCAHSSWNQLEQGIEREKLIAEGSTLS